MSSSLAVKPLVLVMGGTGRTGFSVLQGLARTGAWRLATSVRPISIGKPEVSVLGDLGVEIRLTDWQSATPSELDKLLIGAEVVISTVSFQRDVLLDQKKLVDAAKRTGVKRFIPCDWGTAGPRGVRELLDTKYDVREFVKESGVPYTFVDVGFWMGYSVPVNSADKPPRWVTHEFYGTGDVKSAVTNKDHIGDYVARIIADDRTLNQYVFVYEDEATLNEMWDLAEQAYGKNLDRESARLSEEEILQRDTSIIAKTWYEYMYSIYIRGDNSVANARALGALIVKDLYPDMKYQSLVEFVVAQRD